MFKLKAKPKPYEQISVIYDQIMDHVNYREWVNYVVSICKNIVNENALVLDLGAGNCRFANIMAEFYPKIYAADISESMLKSDKDNLVKKICCNMINLPFRTKFDLIYSTFDSVNYLLTKKDLSMLFNEVKNIMAENSVFLFDVCLENNSKKHAVDNTDEGKSGDISYKQESKYFGKSKIHENIFTLWNNDGKKIKEVHKQRIYNFETYFDLIDRAGLITVDCFDAFTFKNGTPDSDRLQFIVKRKT